MQDGSLRNQIGVAGRDYVTKQYGYREVAQEFVSIVSDDIRSPSRPRSRYTNTDPISGAAADD